MCRPLLVVRSLTTSTKPPSSAYVNPLSALVLSHLQTSHSGFLQRHDLGSLNQASIKSDGTFSLSPSPVALGAAPPSVTLQIWTTFDIADKKHYLQVRRFDSRGEDRPAALREGRFVLQDNLAPAWHSSKLPLVERVAKAVDELVKNIESPN